MILTCESALDGSVVVCGAVAFGTIAREVINKMENLVGGTAHTP